MSRIIKKQQAADLPLHQLAEVEARSPQGIQSFRMRQVHSAASGEIPPGTYRRSGPAVFSGSSSHPEIEEIRKQAFEEGFAEGKRAAARQAAERFQAAIEAFGRTAEGLTALKPRIHAEAEQELVSLAFAIARRIIRRELTVDPQTVLAIIKTCLVEFQRVEIHRLRVSPQDLEPVQGYFRQHPAAHLEVVADPSVPRGGAIFQTSQGQLDARIETQLGEIEYGLADG